MIEATWDEVADMLTTFHQVRRKEDTQMYNLWEFKIKKGTIHRCSADCVAVHGLVLDYDNNLSIEKAIEMYDGFECVIYTTFRNGEEGLSDRFRVVLPFEEPLSFEDFKLKKKSMQEAFTGVDDSSFSLSQALYLHSGPNTDNAFAVRMRGDYLDPTKFENEVIIPYEKTDRTKVSILPGYKKSIIKSLLTCREIRYMNSMSLVVILKSCDATFEDFKAMIPVVCAGDSSIQFPKKQIDVWLAVNDMVTIRAENRDKFIREFGGDLPVFNATTQSTKTKLDNILISRNDRKLLKDLF
jgi:hypothetical protein